MSRLLEQVLNKIEFQDGSQNELARQITQETGGTSQNNSGKYNLKV